MRDVPLVGGKTASLGELTHIGMPVPPGFGITAKAYRYFLKENKLDKRIREVISKTDLRDVKKDRKSVV